MRLKAGVTKSWSTADVSGCVLKTKCVVWQAHFHDLKTAVRFPGKQKAY